MMTCDADILSQAWNPPQMIKYALTSAFLLVNKDFDRPFVASPLFGTAAYDLLVGASQEYVPNQPLTDFPQSVKTDCLILNS